MPVKPTALTAGDAFRMGAPAPAVTLAAALTEAADAAAGRATSYRMNPGDTFTGTVGSPGDSDWIAVRLVAGQSYIIEMDGLLLADSYLELRDADGALLAENDDSGSWDHSRIGFTATQTGTHHVAARGYGSSTGSYQVSVEQVRALSGAEIAAYLTDGFWADQGQAARSYDVAPGGTLTVDMTDLGAAEQRVARMALSAWTEVTGIRFLTGSAAGGAADIHMVNDDAGGAYAGPTSMYGGTVYSSVVNIPVNWAEGPGGGFASYFYQTYLHEIGHALGLGHAGNYDGTAAYGQDNHYPNDSWQATVMSYFDQSDNTAVDASRAYVVTPMIADIIAIQDLYGAPRTIQAADTVWGEGSTVAGAFGTANRLMVARETVTMTILDQGGIDWLKLGGDTRAQVIDLRPGAISNVYGLVGNLSIAAGTVIEHVAAGWASDRITANHAANLIQGRGGNDTIQGLGGNDTLQGGAGSDRLVGGTGDDAYLVDARDSVVELAGEGNDRVTASTNHSLGGHLESLVLTGTAKFGTGNGLANAVTGSGQANYLSGGAGNDTLWGLGGNDTLDGNMGADRLVGGDGSDTYFIDGFDTVVEMASAGLDWIRTTAAITLAAHVEGLQLAGAVRFGTGNGLNNSIFGTDAANYLSGGAGNDRLRAFGGNDTLAGNMGADILDGGAGDDTYLVDVQDTIIEASGQGYDTVTSARDIVLGANLEKAVLTGAWASSVTGNALDNVLTGNGADNVLAGGGGNDVLFGGGGKDVFDFTAAQQGRIGDFQDDLDVIRLSRADMQGRTVGQMLEGATQTATGVTLTWGDGVIRIDGITLDAVQDDLILV